ncbi:MAG TPA: hypothetical protein PLR02_02095 [Rhodocyclaceae bacterium]|nr:hypothetical protein [Rhodocyclaceae bacterium]
MIALSRNVDGWVGHVVRRRPLRPQRGAARNIPVPRDGAIEEGVEV